jgi:hypothetical protein
MSAIPVRDSNLYGVGIDTHDIDLLDHRLESGQVRVVITDHLVDSTEKSPDVLCEVRELPGVLRPVAAFHIAFGNDDLALSLFRQNERAFFLRLEQGVKLVPFMGPDGEQLYRVVGPA